MIKSSNDGVIYHHPLVASHFTGHLHVMYCLYVYLHGPEAYTNASSTNPQREIHLVQNTSIDKFWTKSHCPENGSETCMRFDHWSCQSSELDHVPSFSLSLLLSRSPSPTHTLSPSSSLLSHSSPKYPQPLWGMQWLDGAIVGQSTDQNVHTPTKLKCPAVQLSHLRSP